jgi:hypothetical protein
MLSDDDDLSEKSPYALSKDAIRKQAVRRVNATEEEQDFVAAYYNFNL